ncbi:MAG: AAA family ATPase, partial [Pseudomonadota bacterium]|nr:AAA family ATPase [Pseudomonadota bacterium]
MLTALSIRDVVLIDRLDLDFEAGLNVFTGETGAGKSILLDALSLALGVRGDASLIRTGAERATVTAAFSLPPDHPVLADLRDQALEAEDTLILRRILDSSGRSRAFVNDGPVSISALRRIGEGLVEIHGQFETHGLINQATHRHVLDLYGGLSDRAETVN